MKIERDIFKKKWLAGLISLCLVGLLFLIPEPARADWGTSVANFVGAFLGIFVWLLGKLLVVLISLVVWVAQYNGFISSPAVSIGWVILRDVCNMFFILILLMIAFATILNIEKYSWKHLLPKLLIMAILINFSKLICGVIIDFAQVIMLTFVNGFRDIAGGNFGTMFGIQGLLNISGDVQNFAGGDGVSVLSIAGTYILAVLYVLISLVVITVILFVLVIRIVMLWILVVLSPLAYLLSSTPSTEKYASQWWDQFTNNVVSGPILAFFIWLSFATMQNQTAEGLFGKPPDAGSDQEYYETFTNSQRTASGGPTAGLADAGTQQGMLRFLISIGLLVGGLMVTKQLGGAIGSVAGSGISSISKGGKSLSGYNAVKDRVSAFNKQRDAARTEKINAFGDKWYGRYLTGTSAVKGAAQSTKAAAGTIPVIGKLATPVTSLRQGLEAMKKWPGISGLARSPEYREEQRQKRNRMLDAYENGVYKDHNTEYKQHVGGLNGRTIYTNDVKDKNEIPYATLVATTYQKAQRDENNEIAKDKGGNIIYQDALLEKRGKRDRKGNYIKDENGNIEMEDVVVWRDKLRDDNGNILKDEAGRIQYDLSKGEEPHPDLVVQKMGKTDYEVGKAWTSAMIESRAYNNQKEEKRIVEEQEKMSKAGLTPAQLLGVLKDASASDHKKMGASIELAIKQGFKDKGQVKIMKDLMHLHNNSLVNKKFNDEVDKKQAYLNYDLTTATGRSKMMEREQSGKLDVQKAEAYKDKNFIRAYADVLTDDEFKVKMKRASAYSSKHDDNVKVGLKSYLDEQVPLFNDNKELDKSRKLVKDVTKDLNDVVRGPQINKDNIKTVLKLTFEDMSVSDIGKLDAKSFTPNIKILDTAEKQQAYEQALQEIFDEMGEKRKAKIANNPNAHTKTLDALKRYGVIASREETNTEPYL